jgi:hypothetical protein
MDSATDHQWFLRKHEDGTVFGPLDFAHLAHWASSAQVAPNDAVSSDQLTWMKAPMLPELGMDWIVELTSERYYGPTTLGAINEFIHLGEINQDTFVINACDGSRRQIHDIAALLEAESSASDTNAESATASGPAASGMAVGVQDRIRELEEALRDERRALAEAEERYRELESKYLELLNTRSTL